MRKISKFLTIFLAIILAFTTLSSNEALAKKKKKGKKGGISAEQVQKLSDTIDTLTRKVYASSLFSPEENEQLIDVKIKLDNQMLMSPDVSLAPLYYKAGNLYEARELERESVECFQTILENFPDTALAPKAKNELKKMGIEVKDTKPAE